MTTTKNEVLAMLCDALMGAKVQVEHGWDSDAPVPEQLRQLAQAALDNAKEALEIGSKMTKRLAACSLGDKVDEAMLRWSVTSYMACVHAYETVAEALGPDHRPRVKLQYIDLAWAMGLLADARRAGAKAREGVQS